MRLDLPTAGLDRYKSAAQRARVATESWGENNLFCVNCESPELKHLPANTQALDYLCPTCDASFQLKGQSKPIGHRILDAAYEAMVTAIRRGSTPNLFLLHYEPDQWSVRDLLLVPRFAFTESAIEKRKPLAATARRAGWVGCNILLTSIPPDARIPLILEGKISPPKAVRGAYARLRPLGNLSVEKRGWTLDVLNMVRSLEKPEFSLTEVYSFEAVLRKLHPKNRHIHDKIRQQLQVIRDLGFLEFLGDGNYRLR